MALPALGTGGWEGSGGSHEITLGPKLQFDGFSLLKLGLPLGNRKDKVRTGDLKCPRKGRIGNGNGNVKLSLLSEGKEQSWRSLSTFKGSGQRKHIQTDKLLLDLQATTASCQPSGAAGTAEGFARLERRGSCVWDTFSPHCLRAQT